MPTPNRGAADDPWRRAEAAFQVGDFAEAEALSRAALAQDPEHAGALHGLGLLECKRGRTAEGLGLLRRSIRLNPGNPSAHYNLGMVLAEVGEFAEATASYRRAIDLQPGYAEAWSSLSASLAAQGELAEAAAAARHGLALAPHLVAASANLSVALGRLGDDAGALETILECVRNNPQSAEAWFWMGQALHLRGEHAAALSAFERAIAIDPDHVLAHGQRALSWLAAGDFARGWPEYEWRLRSPGANPRRLSQPRWTGDALAHRTILLHSEQGAGDAIQMLRYVRPLAAQARQIVVEVDAAVLPLVPKHDNIIAVARGSELPDFDVYCPLLSLPLAFGTVIDSVPGPHPYLAADPVRLQAWAQVIPKLSTGAGRRVGVVWAGNPRHQQDRDRSVPLTALAPLFALPDVAWFSLQVGPAAMDAEDSGMTNLGPRLHDFGETAAAILQLDLVITVDTAVAHLAGALGVPVWILLARVADWRWLLDREDSPWYPTARLFRQRQLGDWAEVVARVAGALSKAGIP